MDPPPVTVDLNKVSLKLPSNRSEHKSPKMSDKPETITSVPETANVPVEIKNTKSSSNSHKSKKQASVVTMNTTNNVNLSSCPVDSDQQSHASLELHSHDLRSLETESISSNRRVTFDGQQQNQPHFVLPTTDLFYAPPTPAPSQPSSIYPFQTCSFGYDYANYLNAMPQLPVVMGFNHSAYSLVPNNTAIQPTHSPQWVNYPFVLPPPYPFRDQYTTAAGYLACTETFPLEPLDLSTKPRNYSQTTPLSYPSMEQSNQQVHFDNALSHAQSCDSSESGSHKQTASSGIAPKVHDPLLTFTSLPELDINTLLKDLPTPQSHPDTSPLEIPSLSSEDDNLINALLGICDLSNPRPLFDIEVSSRLQEPEHRDVNLHLCECYKNKNCMYEPLVCQCTPRSTQTTITNVDHISVEDTTDSQNATNIEATLNVKNSNNAPGVELISVEVNCAKQVPENKNKTDTDVASGSSVLKHHENESENANLTDSSLKLVIDLDQKSKQFDIVPIALHATQETINDDPQITDSLSFVSTGALQQECGSIMIKDSQDKGTHSKTAYVTHEEGCAEQSETKAATVSQFILPKERIVIGGNASDENQVVSQNNDSTNCPNSFSCLSYPSTPEITFKVPQTTATSRVRTAMIAIKSSTPCDISKTKSHRQNTLPESTKKEVGLHKAVLKKTNPNLGKSESVLNLGFSINEKCEPLANVSSSSDGDSFSVNPDNRKLIPHNKEINTYKNQPVQTKRLKKNSLVAAIKRQLLCASSWNTSTISLTDTTSTPQCYSLSQTKKNSQNKVFHPKKQNKSAKLKPDVPVTFEPKETSQTVDIHLQDKSSMNVKDQASKVKQTSRSRSVRRGPRASICTLCNEKHEKPIKSIRAVGTSTNDTNISELNQDTVPNIKKCAKTENNGKTTKEKPKKDQDYPDRQNYQKTSILPRFSEAFGPPGKKSNSTQPKHQEDYIVSRVCVSEPSSAKSPQRKHDVRQKKGSETDAHGSTRKPKEKDYVTERLQFTNCNAPDSLMVYTSVRICSDILSAFMRDPDLSVYHNNFEFEYNRTVLHHLCSVCNFNVVEEDNRALHYIKIVKNSESRIPTQDDVDQVVRIIQNSDNDHRV